MATVEQTIRAIEANTAALKKEAATIQADDSLTEPARRQRLREAHAAAQEKHNRLFGEMRAAGEQERAALNDALLAGGRPGEEMRDALDRARQAKDKGSRFLAELVRDASLIEDKSMLRAASYVAAQNGMWGVLRAAADGGFAPAAAVLDFEQASGVLQSTKAKFALKVRTSGPARLAGT